MGGNNRFTEIPHSHHPGPLCLRNRESFQSPRCPKHMSSKKNPIKTIAMALSGGVDSAVGAWLLQGQGYRVIGVHADLGMTDVEKRGQLYRLAAGLRIPLEMVSLEASFRERVVDYLIGEYRRARTPNPCVVCNQTIKFDLLFRKALDLGAEGLATGHYAQRARCPWGKGLTVARGVDSAKDQSYFLHRLDPAVIPYLIFPLGEKSKKEVRNLARKTGIAHNEYRGKPGCLFSASRGLPGIFRKRIGSGLEHSRRYGRSPGEKIGTHRGLYAYTVGQRRGLGLPREEPYYVLRLEADQNRLVIGPRKTLASSGLFLPEVHWLCRPPKWKGLRVSVQIRSRHRPVLGTLHPGPGIGIGIRFDSPQEAVTPGQAAVLYIEDRVIGGGWIEATEL